MSHENRGERKRRGEGERSKEGKGKLIKDPESEREKKLKIAWWRRKLWRRRKSKFLTAEIFVTNEFQKLFRSFLLPNSEIILL
jgi:hypothetical protein